MIIISILHEIILSLCESLLVFYMFSSKFYTHLIKNNLNNLFKYVDNHISEIKTFISKDDLDVLKAKIVINNHENQTIWNETNNNYMNKITMVIVAFIILTHVFILFISMFLNVNPLKFMMSNALLMFVNASVEIAFMYMMTKYQFI